MERLAIKEKKVEEASKKAEISKACATVAEVQAEVDKLCHRVSALQEAVYVGAKLGEKEFILLTEMLMVQLLKLDSRYELSSLVQFYT